jgi:pimeloyl-ACP methyl ester carboxylesterase
MTPVSHTIAVGDLELHYLEQGSGQPLLLLHGGTATASSFAEVIPRLAGRYRVIAPDTRGHGRTNNPAQKLSYQQFADDVAGLIDVLGLSSPIVVGYSDGGQTALELALRHPGKAALLVFGATAARSTPGYIQGMREWGFPAAGEVDLEKLRQVWGSHVDDMRVAHGHHYGPDYLESYLRQISTLWYSLVDYSEPQLASITTPSLVISGDRDHIADADECARFYRLLGAAELAIVPGADHAVIEHHLFWPLVEDFLSRHAVS